MSSSIISITKNGDRQELSIHPPQEGIAFQGTIQIPGDKSISHRALMLGAIAEGKTQVEGLLLGEDPRNTASCFRAMGADISELNSDLVTINGVGLGNLEEPTDILDCGNSGTTIRLMLGLLAAHSDCFFSVTGDSSLRSRPMSRVIKPLQAMGAKIWGRRNDTLAPLAIQGQRLNPTHYHSPVASAQVKSCVLLAGLLAEGKTTVTEPALSRDHSERMLKAFGAEIEVEPQTHSVTVTGQPKLVGQKIIVPGDISSAAFWLVAASILPGSDLLIENVGVNPTRTGILEVLDKMGADITRENKRLVAGEPVADLRVRASQLRGTTIDGEVIPRLIDEIPIIAVAAAFAEGKTIIRDAAELRVKESDRLSAMAVQLERMEATVEELSDGLEIEGSESLIGAELESYGDHRIAMSLAIAALNSRSVSKIYGAEAAAVSYPSFFPTLQKLCQI